MKRVVFISAVTRELKGARQIVANTLVAIDFEPVWQDVFDLSADDIPAMLRKKIDAAGAVIQIVGDAYGAEPPTPPVPFERCSYTQYEALYAKLKKKPVYYLVATPDLPRDRSPEQVDGPIDDGAEGVADAETRRELQAKYKRAILKGSVVYYEVAAPDAIENAVRKLKSKGLGGGRGCQVQFSVAIALSLMIASFGIAALLDRSRRISVEADIASASSERERQRRAMALPPLMSPDDDDVAYSSWPGQMAAPGDRLPTGQFPDESTGDYDGESVASLSNLAHAYEQAGQSDRSLPLYEEALALNRARLGDDHPETLVAMRDLAVCLRDLERVDEASDLFERLLASAVPAVGAKDPFVIRCRYDLAVCLLRAQNIDEALSHLQVAWNLSRDELPAGHPWLTEHGGVYAVALEAAGKPYEATKVREELASLQAQAAEEEPATAP